MNPSWPFEWVSPWKPITSKSKDELKSSDFRVLTSCLIIMVILTWAALDNYSELPHSLKRQRKYHLTNSYLYFHATGRPCYPNTHTHRHESGLAFSSTRWLQTALWYADVLNTDSGVMLCSCGETQFSSSGDDLRGREPRQTRDPKNMF